MKLHACQRRGQREFDDITVLFAICGIRSSRDAEKLYEDFFPGDGFNAMTMGIVELALAEHREAPRTPFPDLG